MLRSAALIILLLIPRIVLSFPSDVLSISGGPPFDFGVSGDITGILLIDDTRLVISFGEVVRLIDTARFAKEDAQPAALSKDDKTDGTIKAIAHSAARKEILAAQSDGDLLIFDINNITAKPVSITISKGKNLGPMAVDATGGKLYIADITDRKVHAVDLSKRAVEATIALTSGTNTSFAITDASFNSTTADFYFTTDGGALFVIPNGGTAATQIDLGVANGNDIVAAAATPNGAFIYAVDSTTPGVAKINAQTKAIVKPASELSLAANTAPTEIVITDVARPKDGGSNGIYAFVVGAKGISVINTTTDEMFDLGSPDNAQIAREPIPAEVVPRRLVASSSTDGYIYLANQTGSIGLLTANPFITLRELSFSGGRSALGENIDATLIFQSDMPGNYEIRVGGGITANGSLLTFTNGSTSKGTISAANSNVNVGFSYNDNKGLLAEGNNTLFIFATSSAGDRGRLAKTLKVDTPPPAVTINSIGFGNGKLFVNLQRLSTSDIKKYNLYISTDSAAVTTKQGGDAEVAQGSEETVTGVISGLANGVRYFIAAEAEDAGGNKSASRTTTLSSGGQASGTPQVTAGPAGLSGELGSCSLIIDDRLESR